MAGCSSREGAEAQPLFGREAEHRGIVQYLQQRLAMDHGKILLLCGPCGVGKSSTIQRVLRLPAAAASHTGAAKGATPAVSHQVDVPVARMQSIASTSTAAPRRSRGGGVSTASQQPPEGLISMRRELRCHYLNCTDLSAADLVAGIVQRLTFRQRASDMLRAKVALLELVGNGKAFDAKLDAALDAHYHPRIPTTPDAMERCPMHVLVLDEADAAKRGATVALRHLTQLVLRCPLWFTLVCVSNDRWLSFLPVDDDATVRRLGAKSAPPGPQSHSEFSDVRVVTFAAYDADVLKRIGELAVLEQHHASSRRHGSGGTPTDDTVVASSAALAFAAKSVVLHHCGDARKVKELCCRAAEEASLRAISSRGEAHCTTTVATNMSTGGIRDVTNRSLPPARGGPTSKKRARSPTLASQQQPTTVHTVTLRDVVEAAKDPLRPDASQLVMHLPELTTYVLCCIVVAARRQVVADYVRRTSIGGAKSTGSVACNPSALSQLKAAALRQTNDIAIRDCGDMSEHEVYRLYAALMLRMMFPLCTREGVTRSLEDLAARRVITNNVHRFVCTGEWSLVELEAALVDKGTALVRREAEMLGDDAARAALLTNKFTTALHDLATAC